MRKRKQIAHAHYGHSFSDLIYSKSSIFHFFSFMIRKGCNLDDYHKDLVWEALCEL